MDRRAFLAGASLVSLGVLAGCGGGRGGAAGRGRVEMRVRWPETTTRLIPVASQSVVVTLLRAGAKVGERILARGGSVVATFDDLPVGDYTLWAGAFPAAGGKGVALATGEVPVRVDDGQTAAVRLTMASTIASLSLTAANLTVGDTATLAVTARNGSGEVVLVAPGALRWRSDAPAVVSVDTQGTATALSAGTATVEVEDTESRKTAQASVAVKALPSVPSTPVPMFLYDRRRTGRSVYASRASGRPKWIFSTGDYIWASPVLDDEGTVYVLSNDGVFYAIDGERGTERWKAQESGPGPFRSTAAFGLDDTVVYGAYARVVARDRRTGAVRWEHVAPGLAMGSSPVALADGTIVVGLGQQMDDAGEVVALDGTTGAVKWRVAFAGGVESSPSVASDGTLYVGTAPASRDGIVVALDSATGAKKWESPARGVFESSPAIGDDGTVYIGARALGPDDGLYALDGATGAVKWRFDAFDVRGCPSIGLDGSLYVGSGDGNIYALTPSGQEKWRFTTQDQVKSTPILAPDGTLYGGGKDGSLYALDAGSGALKWKFDSGNYMFSSPAIAKDGTIVFTNFSGLVVALS